MTTIVEPLQKIAGLIAVDAGGVARIAGSRIKVAHLAVEHAHRGLTPEQIVASEQLVERMRAKAGASPVAARLRAEGFLPRSETPANPQRTWG